MKQTPIKTIYFPICLLADFPNNQDKAARKILTYSFNAIAAKSTKETATQKVGFVNFEKCEVDAHSPITYYSLDAIRSIANGNELDKNECLYFLFTCAVRSLLGKKTILLTNWQQIASRMCGKTFIAKSEDLNVLAKKIIVRNHTLTEKLKQLLQEFDINFYSTTGLHGFYLHTLDKHEFTALMTEKLQKAKDKTVKDEKKKKSVKGASEELIKLTFERFCKEVQINDDFISFVRANWDGSGSTISTIVEKYAKNNKTA